MADYTKITDFAAKDSLLTGNPLKLITGTAHDDEYNAIATAVATKADKVGATLTNSTMVTPNIGTPSAGTLTNCTGLPVSTGVSGLGTGVATFLATPSSANLASAVTGETGSGALVFATSPSLVTPDLGTPSALVGTNITGTAAGLSIGGNAATATSATTATNISPSTGSFAGLANGATTTIFTIPSADISRYEITAYLNKTGGTSAEVASYATVVQAFNASPRIVANNGTQFPISLSGQNVQVTNNTGSTYDGNYVSIRLG